jgi:hypothetical protein
MSDWKTLEQFEEELRRIARATGRRLEVRFVA